MYMKMHIGNLGSFLINFVISTILFQQVNSARILVLHPIYSGSHIRTLRKLTEGLSLRGHEIEIIKWKEPIKSVTETNNSKIDNVTITTVSMDNSDGRWYGLSTEKEASFVVMIFKQGFNLNYA